MKSFVPSDGITISPLKQAMVSDRPEVIASTTTSNKCILPIEWVNADSDSRNYHLDEASIKLITMHSSKGLEFPVVCIPGIGYMPAGEPSFSRRGTFNVCDNDTGNGTVNYHLSQSIRIYHSFEDSIR